MVELLTSLDVVNQSFKKSIRGYDAEEVDEFLDTIAETLQTYAQRTKELERELSAKEESLTEYENMKTVLHEALIMAQKSADDRIRNARDQATKIIADAEVKAKEICADAAVEADKLRGGVYQIKNIRDLYEQEFRGMLAKYDNLLNQTIAGSSLNVAVESVLEAVEPEAEPDPGEKNVAPTADKKNLEAAYNMLGVNPKEILSDANDDNED